MDVTTPALTVASLTVDCADPGALAAFWAKVLGRLVGLGATAENATLEASGPASGPKIFFQKVPEAKSVKNRLHLDLLADHYAEQVERLTGLGAKPLNEVELPGARWTTFADPEGNEFDVITWRP